MPHRRMSGAAVVLLSAVLPAAAQTAPSAAGTAAYVDGIDALAAADWPGAAGAFTRALAADPDNPDIVRARGVALALAEKFTEAAADLQRALRLRADDREAKLWLAAALRMGGDPEKGSLFFTHGGDVPKEYADLVYNEMAMDYWSSRYQGTVFDRRDGKNVPAAEPVRTRFPEAAAIYVRRHRPTGPGAFAQVFGRARAALERGDAAAAARDLDSLRSAAPDDPGVGGLWAACRLALGDADGARREATHILSVDPYRADLYAGRAEAAAVLGDARRMQSDLAACARHAHPSADAVRARASAKLGAPAPDDAPARFASAAADPRTERTALVAAAREVRRWAEARRLRFDEGYQDRIRVLAEAVRDVPGDADAHERYARFLVGNIRVPVLWNGPRGGGEPLRIQSAGEQRGELERAVASADRALTIAPRHANAMGAKARAFAAAGRMGDAEAWADRGLAVEPRNIPLLRLKAKVLLDAASALVGQASALRSDRVETSRETRSDGVYEVTRRYPPSAADLARAAALEAQAAALQRQGDALARRASEVETSEVPALLKRGDAAGSPAGALAAYREAEACAPDSRDVLTRLAGAHRKAGDERTAGVYALLAEPPGHTTAADPLKSAWESAVRTAWGEAGASLDRASAADPADARTPAYRSVTAAGRGDADGAARERRAALALEEARAGFRGTSLLPPASHPLTSPDAGLTMLLRTREGNGRLASGDAAGAIELLEAVAKLEPRFPKEVLYERVPSAMTPDPSGDPGSVPEAPTTAGLLAEARLGLARAYLAANRPEDAAREFQAVRDCTAFWPATVPGRESVHLADAWARLGQAQAAIGTGDLEKAHLILDAGEGFPGGLPAGLYTQKKALSEQVRREKLRKAESDRLAEERMTPDQLRRRRIEEEIAAFRKQRDGYAAELKRADLPEADRRVCEMVIRDLDQQIARRQAMLDRPQADPEEPEPPAENPAPTRQRPPTRSRRFQ